MDPPPPPEPLCARRGATVALREASVPLRDRAFQHGEGLFETIRVVRGKPFRLAAHLERLRAGAEALGIGGAALAAGDAARIAADLLDAFGPHDAVLKLYLTAGDPPALDPSFFATVAPPRPLPPGARERGVALALSAIRTNPTSPIARLKTTSYLERSFARRLARAAGAYDALFLQGERHVAECASSNIFWGRGGRLRTPAPGLGLLPGLTRALVIELAAAAGIAVEAGAFPFADLAGAEEAFLTNALVGVLPVREVDGLPVGAGPPGPLTRELAARLEAVVAKECP